jgi:hypothetical protein
MLVLQQLHLQREKLDKEINVVFNELYVLVNSLPRSDNVDPPICSSIISSLFDTPQKRKRGDDDYNNNNRNSNNITIIITITITITTTIIITIILTITTTIIITATIILFLEKRRL